MCLRLAGTGLEFHPLSRIHVDTVHVKNPVKVRSSGPSRGTSVAQNIASLNLGAGRDREFRHVKIHGLESLAVVNSDGIAQDVERLGKGNGSSRNGADGFAGGSALIDTAVIFASRLLVVQPFDAERRGHAARDGRGKRISPESGIGNTCLEGLEESNFFRS